MLSIKRFLNIKNLNLKSVLIKTSQKCIYFWITIFLKNIQDKVIVKNNWFNIFDLCK